MLLPLKHVQNIHKYTAIDWHAQLQVRKPPYSDTLQLTQAVVKRGVRTLICSIITYKHNARNKSTASQVHPDPSSNPNKFGPHLGLLRALPAGWKLMSSVETVDSGGG